MNLEVSGVQFEKRSIRETGHCSARIMLQSYSFSARTIMKRFSLLSANAADGLADSAQAILKCSACCAPTWLKIATCSSRILQKSFSRCPRDISRIVRLLCANYCEVIHMPCPNSAEISGSLYAAFTNDARSIASSDNLSTFCRRL
jgi:hypothetical protein